MTNELIMGRRRIVFYGGLIALAVGWFAYGSRHTIGAGARTPMGTASVTPASPIATSPVLAKLYRRTERVGTVDARKEQPKPVQAPFTEPGKVIAEERAMAEGGSSGAMAAMAFALHRCSRAAADTDEEIIDKAAKRSISMESAAAQMDIPLPQRALEIATYGAQEAMQIRESCKDVSPDDIARWREWMKKAASAGDVGARVQLAETLADAYPAESRSEDQDRYTADRDAAFDQLLDDFGSGDCGQGVLSGITASSPDETTAYIFRSLLLKQVLDLVPGKDVDSDDYRKAREMMKRYERDLAAGIPHDQLAAAAGTIDYLQQTFCH